MEKKCARAACRIEETSVKWIRNHLVHHDFRKPVRRVVFTESLASLAAYKVFVQNLEDILINFAPHKTHQTPCQSADERLPAFHLKYPVKEVRFDNTINTGISELVAG